MRSHGKCLWRYEMTEHFIILWSATCCLYLEVLRVSRHAVCCDFRSSRLLCGLTRAVEVLSVRFKSLNMTPNWCCIRPVSSHLTNRNRVILTYCCFNWKTYVLSKYGNSGVSIRTQLWIRSHIEPTELVERVMLMDYMVYTYIYIYTSIVLIVCMVNPYNCESGIMCILHQDSFR